MSDASDIAALKAVLRETARRGRAALSDAERTTAAGGVAGQLTGLALPPGVIAGYWPLADELNIRPALIALRRQGHTIALPVTGPKQTPLTFRRWDEGAALERGRFDTRHPSVNAPEVIPDVVLLPLLAFDRRGNRLGYGGGYYDRTLARLRDQGPVLAVGVAFAIQEMEELPAGRYDRPLDLMVTEQEIIAGDRGAGLPVFP